jgi:hypothetical protein
MAVNLAVRTGCWQVTCRVMIAIARIRLPYEVPVAQTVHQARTTHWRSWKVIIHPLEQAESEDPDYRYLGKARGTEDLRKLVLRRGVELPAAGVTLNGQLVVLCNVLTIEFLNVEYDRRISDLPKEIAANLAAGIPSVTEVFDLANSYIAALRAVSGLAMLRELEPTRVVWVIDYLDDSRDQLPREEGKLRSRQSQMGPLPWGAVFNESADAAFVRLDQPDPAPWDLLMLQAVDQLPSIGPAIVLAFAGFEQLVNSVISTNVPTTYTTKQRKAALSNKRSSPLDRADTVLYELIGQTLRSQRDAWPAAEELAGLRNRYLHHGIAPTFATQPFWFAAGQLLRRVSEGMLWLEGFLPSEKRRDRAIKGVNVKYDLPHPSSPIFGEFGGLVLYLPNDPTPAVIRA